MASITTPKPRGRYIRNLPRKEAGGKSRISKPLEAVETVIYLFSKEGFAEMCDIGAFPSEQR